MDDLADGTGMRAQEIAMLISRKKLLWRRFILDHIFGGALCHFAYAFFLLTVNSKGAFL